MDFKNRQNIEPKDTKNVKNGQKNIRKHITKQPQKKQLEKMARQNLAKKRPTINKN